MAKPKIIIPTTIEMEVAISRLFDVRKHIIVPNLHWGFGIHECDMFAIKKTGYAIEVEIKRTIADLKKDAEKKHCHEDNRIKELYFAVPLSLLEKARPFIPERAGIITVKKEVKAAWAKNVKGKYWTSTEIIRRPQRNKSSRKLTEEEIKKVLTLGVMRVWGLKEKLILRAEVEQQKLFE